MKNEELLAECAEIVKKSRLTSREMNLIFEWKKTYSREEIIKAVRKAVLKKARFPISHYSTRILEENRIQLSKEKQRTLEIEVLENRIKERESRYE